MSPLRQARCHHRRTTRLSHISDVKTYVTAAAQGIHSGSGAGGFVWLITDALSRLSVVATYGAGKLLVAEPRQSLAPELGGIYESARLPPSSSSLPIGRTPAYARSRKCCTRFSVRACTSTRGWQRSMMLGAWRRIWRGFRRAWIRRRCGTRMHSMQCVSQVGF